MRDRVAAMRGAFRLILLVLTILTGAGASLAAYGAGVLDNRAYVYDKLGRRGRGSRHEWERNNRG
jgi:hypothetical protein